ncbi:site-specific integrase [Ureibacillus acetophenoni]|uniref:Site-specific recombinase XerD n=1 Tax=Ureibacillus acetophenoni TaxID=614649 RepID=A0A285URH4_9BACL|nr:site-specific integrase [Ureibacillus acetophenoni]SOC44460.1 site-specific recombinase XerD [Ureibacillus acetophenoni]
MSIYVDKERGTYYIAYSYTNDYGLRTQFRKRGFKTKKEAEKILTEFKNDLFKGTLIIPSKIQLSDYITKWLRANEYTYADQTFRLYEGVINNHINPFLGNVIISKIKTQHIQGFIKNLYEKELKVPTIIRILGILTTCLNSAVNEGLIRENAATKVKKPTKHPKEMKFWNVDHILSFLKTAKDDPLYMVFFLAIMTGLRRGEILGLRWKDVNFDDQVLSIYQTVDNTGRIKMGTKTLKSTRTIAISDKTVEELKKHKQIVESRMEELEIFYGDLDVINCTSKGTPLSPRNVNRSFKRLVKKAGVPDIRFHDLRHTHVALMISQNEPVKLISERLGHSKINITMDTYGHILPTMQQEAANRLDDTLFNKNDE